MPVYRYKKTAVDIETVRRLVPGSPSLMMSSSNTYADISLAEEHLTDLDEAMTSLGYSRDSNFVFLISAQLVGDEKSVPSTAWTVLGGVIANPGFFTQRLERCMTRLLGEAKTSDTTIELRFVEQETNTILGTVAVGDTVGVWTAWDGWASTPPSPAGVTFYIEGRQVSPGPSASALVRFVSSGLCELLT